MPDTGKCMNKAAKVCDGPYTIVDRSTGATTGGAGWYDPRVGGNVGAYPGGTHVELIFTCANGK